jgi:hypothetical protein
MPAAWLSLPISEVEFKVLAAICQYATLDSDNGCLRSYSALGELVGMHRDTVKRAVARLRDLQVVSVERRWVNGAPSTNLIVPNWWIESGGVGADAHLPPGGGGCASAPGGRCSPAPHKDPDINTPLLLPGEAVENPKVVEPLLVRQRLPEWAQSAWGDLCDRLTPKHRDRGWDQRAINFARSLIMAAEHGIGSPGMKPLGWEAIGRGIIAASALRDEAPTPFNVIRAAAAEIGDGPAPRRGELSLEDEAARLRQKLLAEQEAT